MFDTTKRALSASPVSAASSFANAIAGSLKSTPVTCAAPRRAHDSVSSPK